MLCQALYGEPGRTQAPKASKSETIHVEGNHDTMGFYSASKVGSEPERRNPSSITNLPCTRVGGYLRFSKVCVADGNSYLTLGTLG